MIFFYLFFFLIDFDFEHLSFFTSYSHHLYLHHFCAVFRQFIFCLGFTRNTERFMEATDTHIDAHCCYFWWFALFKNSIPNDKWKLAILLVNLMWQMYLLLWNNNHQPNCRNKTIINNKIRERKSRTNKLRDILS